MRHGRRRSSDRRLDVFFFFFCFCSAFRRCFVGSWVLDVVVFFGAFFG